MEDISRLPIAEKILIVEDIWDSIIPEVQAIDDLDMVKVELDKRWEKIDNGQMPLSPWHEVKSRTRKKL
jgi:putative addiction module component (TIGR02574 family)